MYTLLIMDSLEAEFRKIYGKSFFVILFSKKNIMDTLLNTIYYKEHNYDGVDQLYQKAKKRNKNITKRGWLLAESVIVLGISILLLGVLPAQEGQLNSDSNLDTKV